MDDMDFIDSPENGFLYAGDMIDMLSSVPVRRKKCTRQRCPVAANRFKVE